MITCDDPVSVHGDTANPHLVLDDAETGAGDEVPEDGRPVPAPGDRVPSLRRHTSHLQLVVAQTMHHLGTPESQVSSHFKQSRGSSLLPLFSLFLNTSNFQIFPIKLLIFSLIKSFFVVIISQVEVT